MNCACLVWMREKCGGEDMIVLFKNIKHSCKDTGWCIFRACGGKVEEKARLRLEMRSQGSKTWRELAEDHHRVSIQVFLTINIWARSIKPWESEMQVWRFWVCGSPRSSRGDGDPQTRRGFRLLCNFWPCFLHHLCSEHIFQICSCDCGASHTFPTSSHCCHSPITLPMGTHIGTNSWSTLGASQLCSSWKSLWKREVSPLKESMWEILVFAGQDRKTDGCRSQEPAVLVRCICTGVLYDVKLTLLPSSAS